MTLLLMKGRTAAIRRAKNDSQLEKVSKYRGFRKVIGWVAGLGLVGLGFAGADDTLAACRLVPPGAAGAHRLRARRPGYWMGAACAQDVPG